MVLTLPLILLTSLLVLRNPLAFVKKRVALLVLAKLVFSAALPADEGVVFVVLGRPVFKPENLGLAAAALSGHLGPERSVGNDFLFGLAVDFDYGTRDRPGQFELDAHILGSVFYLELVK